MAELAIDFPAWLGPVGLILTGAFIVAQVLIAIDTLIGTELATHQAAALATPVTEYEASVFVARDTVDATVQQAEDYLADRPFNWQEEGL